MYNIYNNDGNWESSSSIVPCPEWIKENGYIAVKSNNQAGMGWRYVKGVEYPPKIDKERLVREERNDYLIEIDEIVTNPLRWDELTETEKESLSKYRKELLDVTKQPGYPNVINWPKRPSILK